MDQENPLRPKAKINFLKKEIQIPDGISDEFTNEVQNTLSFYENRLLKLGQELNDCDETSRQHERCLRSYNQFKV